MQFAEEPYVIHLCDSRSFLLFLWLYVPIIKVSHEVRVKHGLGAGWLAFILWTQLICVNRSTKFEFKTAYLRTRKYFTFDNFRQNNLCFHGQLICDRANL